MKRYTIILITNLIFCLFVSDLRGQNKFPIEEYKMRREKIFEKIGNNIAVVWGAHQQTAPVRVRQSPNFYYLTGIEEPNAILVLAGNIKKSFIYLNKVDDNTQRWTGYTIWQELNFKDKYGLDSLYSYENFWTHLFFFSRNTKKIFITLSSPDQVDLSRMESSITELKFENFPIDYLPFWKKAIKKINETLPSVELADVNPLIDSLRWIKSEYEIDLMKESGRIGAEGVLEAIRNTKPDMFEYELEAIAKYTFLKHGARGDAFAPIVASGPNTYIIHYQKNDRQFYKGDIILMDYGCDYKYYTSDVTRVWPVSGKFSSTEEKMYLCILEARDSMIAAMKPGITLKELKELSYKIYKKNGFEDKDLSWNSYIGHYVGLSVHDVFPYDLDKPLETGVVFNVEPVIDNPEKKIHMRLEDTILITEDGAINLTSKVPANLSDIYKILNK
jgi:Xaa-Pro aminopeptidase